MVILLAADGSIIIETEIDDKKAQQELNRLNRRIQNLNDQIYVKRQQQMPLVEQARQLGAELDAAKAKLDSMQSGREFNTSSSIDSQAQRVKQLEKEWSDVQRRVESYDDQIQKANISLGLAKEQAGAVQQQLAAAGPSSEAMANAMNRMEKSANRFSSRLREVVRSALVFTLISQALASLREWFGRVIKTNDEATEAIGRLKGALLTLAQPLVSVIIPAFTMFVNVLTRIIQAISDFVSWLFGTTSETSADAAENLYEESEALESVGAAADEAAGSLAGFDEINTINTKNAAGSSAGGSGLDKIKPIFENFDTLEYKRKIDEITAYVSGALLALGAILAFSGVNIPLGLALMAAGAIGLVSVIKENWGAMDERLRAAISQVLITLETAAFVIGAILAFSGENVPLGIALMIAGAASLATAAALNWEYIPDNVKRIIIEILNILGVSLLVIGTILALSGANIPLGIALMALGAASLATAIALNWNEVSGNIKNVISEILVYVGASFLALGAILALSGVNLPLGIKLMAIGAASLATAAALNWEYIPDNVKRIIIEILNILGVSLLVIGTILALSGANIPLGIALMALGAASLATAIALNWNEVSGNIKNVISEILVYVGASFLALGAILALSGVNLPLGIKLMAIGAASLATAAALNWSAVVDAIRGPIGAILATISSILIVLGLVLALSGVALPLGIALIAAGAVGLVTVGALNWNAILEKLKEVWESIKKWWNASVSKYLSLDYWKGIGKDILNGLWEGLKSIWSDISNWVSEKVGWIVDQFTGATSSARSGTFGSTSSGSFGGRSIPSIQSFSIPALATGSVIPPNREFLAVLGDNKQETEVVSPLSTMKQAVLEAMRESGMTDGTITVVVNLDGKEVARNSVKHINNMTRQAGRSVLLI